MKLRRADGQVKEFEAGPGTTPVGPVDKGCSSLTVAKKVLPLRKVLYAGAVS
jgi:hypothetical protein